VHYFDPHNPFHARIPWIDHYTPRALTRELELTKKSWDNLPRLVPMLKKDPAALSNLIALYDSEINFVDFYIEKLIKKFKLDENTLIIITSDHGEEFLEHDNIGHSYNLYNETLCIPLIIKMPFSLERKIVEEQVTLLDIMPSILNLLKITPPEQALGKISLTKKETSEYIFSELDRNARLKTILTSKWKYIYDYESKTSQLYNLKSDPSESQNLIRKEVSVGKQLHEQLFDWAEHAQKYPTTQENINLSEEEKEKLKELGYIE
jgi:arylsulfatase A-like enzyme